MILHIDDKTNSAKPLYYQSLVLLFLPCEKFSENDNQNELFISAYTADGVNHADVKLKIGDRWANFSDSERVDESKYAQMKNLIGRTLLRCAEKLFDKTIPWGISTGVKPVKLARMFISKFGRDKAKNILINDYSMTESKANLAIEACITEDRMMCKMGDNPCSLYISIPFCPTKCNYCSFVSCTTPRLLSLIPEYLTRLKDELEIISECIDKAKLNLKSIYVGGGTPAILDEGQIDFLLSSVKKHFCYDGCEFTFEAGRPDCITPEKLKILHDYNVERISINTQTTNDAVLRSIGRNHTYEDYVRAMESAREVGFKCINTDLIAGLPGESLNSFKKSVTEVAALCPENITVHSFTLKKSSNFRMSGDKSFDVTDSEALYMTDFANEYLSSLDYSPYYIYRQKNTAGNLENVGYSKDGLESIYNVIMMGEYHTVLSAGAGSVTKIVLDDGNRVERIFSPKYPYEFLDKDKYCGFDKESVLNLIKEG